ncbi:MAG: hypothetical protein E7650_00190 [Ruminococcaceae bacterium]|nr:hypothetical protein [Oscillospiraceae bacterium]
MALLKKRPLAMACICLIISTACAFFLPVFWCGIAAVAASVAFLIVLTVMLSRGYRYSLLCVLLVCLLVALGLLRTGFYRRGTPRLEERIGQSVQAVLTVEEVRYSNAYTSELLVRVDTLGDEHAGFLAILALDYATPFYSGDILEGEFICQTLAYDSYYPTQQYHYMAEGCRIMLLGSSDTPPILQDRISNSLNTTLLDLRHYLSLKLTNAVSGDAGRLLSAMLLGTRDMLPDTLTRDFGRAGVAHLLALSGLHVGILALIFDRLLCLFAIGKRWRALATMLFLGFYFAMTGGALSTLRAVIMFGVVYLAFFCKTRADALTSLFLAASGIVLIHPFAVFSVSFQMTVLATLGILAYSALGAALLRRLRERRGLKGILYKCLGALMLSLVISLSAGFAVLPVQWYAFGTLAAMTPISNLIILPLATPFLLLGLATLFLFPSGLFGVLAGYLGELMLHFIEWLASFRAVFSLQYAFVPYLLWPLLIAAAVLLLLDLKKRRWCAGLPILAFVLCFAVGVCIVHRHQAGQIEVAYRVSGKQEGIVCTSAGRSLLIDVSGGSYAQLNEDWSLACDGYATQIDVLCLTHYHTAHAAGFSKLASRVTVRQLWVPTPTTVQEAQTLQALFENATACGTAVVLYEYGTPLTVFRVPR